MPTPTPTLPSFSRFSQEQPRYTEFSSTDSSFEDPVDPAQLFLGGGTDEGQLGRGGSSSDDEGDEAVSGLGLSVLTARSEGKRRKTITTPFSRPPSAVTVPYQPSRTPSSAALDARASATTSSSPRLGASQPHPRRSRRSVGPAEALSTVSSHGRLTDGNSWGLTEGRGEGGRSGREDDFSNGERKGKGKVKERPTSRSYAAANDPLDLMSALRHAPPHPAQARTHPVPHRISSYEPIAFPAYPSSSSVASGSQPTSTSSESGPPAPQSLQQLLQTVDLSAALLLVQTLQSHQSQNASIPTLSTALPSLPLGSSPSHPSPPSNTRHLPHLIAHQSSSTALSNGSDAVSLAESSDIQTPLLSSAFPTSSSPQRVSIDEPSKSRLPHTAGSPVSSSGAAGVGEKKDRRRSLSLNFGVGNVGKRLRTGSTAQASLWAGKDRVPDARAMLGEGGRGFEEQISRVHLTLSPASMRRAQNCAKYLSLRYTPVYASISSSLPIPNLIATSRWRDKREEVERNQRRARFGTGGRTRLRDDGGTDGEGTRNGARSETGSSSKGGITTLNPRFATPVYGPRRNKHPKAWEVYPDEVADYIAAGGQVDQDDVPEQEAVEKASSDGGAGLQSFPSRGTNGSSSIKLEDRFRAPGTRSGSPTGSNERGSSLRPLSHSRSNSYEGSLFAKTNGAKRTSLEPPSLRRAGSYGSASPHPTPNTPFSTLATISSMESGAPKVWSNGYASGGAQSGQSSREHLPDLSSSPRPAFGSPTAKKSSRFRLSSPQLDGSSPTTNKPAVTEGIRSNLSRRLDRMRKKPNTDVETSDVSRSALVASGSVTDLAWTPDVSEGEGLARSSPRVQSPVADQGKFRRSRMRKNGTDGAGKSVGIDSTDAPSGGEEGLKSRRGRFLAAAWQGFKVSLDTYPGGDGRLPAGPAALERRVRRRIIYADESDDEDIEVPREVLDLSDEEFLKFNGILRQLRAQVAQGDSILPRVPADINLYLDKITHHETTTRLSFGIPVEYAFPRLSASIVSQLADSKKRDYADAIAEHSSGSSSDTFSLSSSNDEDDEEHEHGELEPPARFRTGSPRQRVVKVHARRVTDPISRATVVRARSRTVGSPLAANREHVRPSETPVDSLGRLEKAIEELKKAARDVDVEAERLTMYQERVGKEIDVVNHAVDEVQRAIDRENFQQLRKLEEHYSRLRTSLTRPSSAVDLFWAALSYVLTVLFYLSWLAVTLFRIFRTILSLPILAIRWLFYIR